MISLIIFINVVRTISTIFFFYNINNSTIGVFDTISELLVNIVMSLIFFPLICMMKKYHNFEYNRIKKSMIYFYIAEMSVFIFIQLDG